jgi:uroporphyrinogen decarboxylase
LDDWSRIQEKIKGDYTVELSQRERFLRTLRYEPVDRRPVYLAGPWPDTLARWHNEGLPADVTDVHEYLGVKKFGYRMTNITPIAGLYPPFTQKVIGEEGDFISKIDSYGRTVRDFKDHTSFPEWIDFPVKEAADLRRLMDEHFDVSDLDARFAPDWAEKAKAAEACGDILMIDGGCYYWTLRSIAGVDGASYLLYDCPELVDELCERYFTVVMEGLRRAVKTVKVDAIGFGEDFAFKTGPLLSPDMFRRFILPRYAKAMKFAHGHGITLTWHDSDGDCRMLLPDMLAVGVNSSVPCEVAANMDPVALRKQFGRDLRIGGGFDKRIVAKGPEAVKCELERLAPVIHEGGFIPGIDHSIPADVSWDNYRRYSDLITKAVEIQ